MNLKSEKLIEMFSRLAFFMSFLKKLKSSSPRTQRPRTQRNMLKPKKAKQ